MNEPYRLHNDPPPRKPWRPSKGAAQRQTLLFSGLDCLPGQQDLFQTDGAADSDDQQIPDEN